MTLLCTILTSTITHISLVTLTLDGVTSFQCVKNVTNTCKRLRYCQKFVVCIPILIYCTLSLCRPVLQSTKINHLKNTFGHKMLIATKVSRVTVTQA